MTGYELADLKLIYRVLHTQLLGHDELVDSHFFHDLQRHLQAAARAEGVDLADHSAWDAWLSKEQNA